MVSYKKEYNDYNLFMVGKGKAPRSSKIHFKKIKFILSPLQVVAACSMFMPIVH